MGKFILLFLFLPLSVLDMGSALLSKIPLYQKESYFKSKVYQEKVWKDFYELPEARQSVNPQQYDFHLLNAALFYATNKLREKHGLPPLKFSEGLRDAATIHTDQMIRKNFFSHYNHSGPKKLSTPESRMMLFINTPHLSGENCDENYVEWDENLSYIAVAERILNDLYSSPPHRSILLGKGFHYLGGAILFESVKGKEEAIYLKATQDFTSNI